MKLRMKIEGIFNLMKKVIQWELLDTWKVLFHFKGEMKVVTNVFLVVSFLMLYWYTYTVSLISLWRRNERRGVWRNRGGTTVLLQLSILRLFFGSYDLLTWLQGFKKTVYELDLDRKIKVIYVSAAVFEDISTKVIRHIRHWDRYCESLVSLLVSVKNDTVVTCNWVMVSWFNRADQLLT